MSRALLLMLWGWTVLWSWGSGRLDLLLRNVFHGLVGTAGLAMLATGLLMLFNSAHYGNVADGMTYADGEI